MNARSSGLRFTGQSVTRSEDHRLLTGKGRFVADVASSDVLHAVFVRSPFAHANIVSIDITPATAIRGVVGVFTAAEINKPTNPFFPMLTMAGLYTPLFKAMSDKKVRHVGDPVALVIAQSRYLAEDAAELVDVEYDHLDPISTIAQALDPSLDQLWEKADGNVLYNGTDSFGSVDHAFAKADRVITERFKSHRQSNQPMETRGSVVEVDPDSGHLTIHNTSQAPHFLKWSLAGLSSKRSRTLSIQAIAASKSRRTELIDGAKNFIGTNKEKLARQDNAGMKSQLLKDRSMLGHMLRTGLGLASATDLPTVKAVDIGGAFGSKGPVSREDVALVVAARKIGRSIQWIEDRVENLTDGGQARDETFTMSLAVDNDGTFRGLRCDAIIDNGAYPAFPISAATTKQLWKVYMPGPYHFEAFELRSRIVATNKGKVVPYRGPWANETWARERIIDVAAGELGIHPGELRRRNIITDANRPPAFLTGPTLDETMSAAKTLDRALEMIDFNRLRSDKANARQRGHRLGLGIATYHEAAPGPPNFFDSVSPGSDLFTGEQGRATIEAGGKIVMYTSQSPHGQSHQTTYKQVVADEFGVGLDDVEIVWGDTDRTQFSFLGTGGSRGGPLGAGVMRATARKVREEVVELAAKLLEASPADIQIIAGNIHVSGVPARGLTYADVARRAHADRGSAEGPAFDVVMDYQGVGNGGWSVATHVAWVDLDMDTGKATFPRYLVVEDCGPMINPAVVDGQIRGGVAQGIGAVFYEHLCYDESANLLTTTYMDYLVPTAIEIPEIEIEHMETLTDGENDARGVGEGGMIGAPAALTNAVSDALGVRVTDQHLPPWRILELAGVIEPD